ncbi:unnamed protein product [Caenorhabditis angaria]|uniref:Ubiquitin-like domain-containing protein n=1 Tax=Caenorhabditis angaria TaxID=860376 RepID=A0A9P1INB1_9PELO|nr:unnamed protein product [Caenorhabditis angaria]
MRIIDTIISYISENVHIEGTAVLGILVIILCFYISFIVSWRKPLYYYLFLVEMHTWSTRRIVQVLHLGQEYMPTIGWNRLVSRMRARAPRFQGETRVAVSDTNIVIQSPNTVIDSPVSTRSPDPNRITFWDIEMPRRPNGQLPDATRDSQYAAAAAIAILARGVDGHMRSHVFFDNLRNSTSDSPSRNRVAANYNIPGTRRRFEAGQNVAQPREYIPEEHIDEDHVPTDYSSFLPEEEEEEESTRVEENMNENEELEEEEEENEEVPQEDQEKVLIRLKFMNDTEKETFYPLTLTIGQYKKAEFFSNGNNNNSVVRLIYQGQLLRDDNRTLESYGLKSGSVLHCHISSTPYTRASTSNHESDIPSTSQPSNSLYPPPRRRERHELALASQAAAREAAQQQLFENEETETTTVQMLRIINLLLYSIIPIVTALGFDILRLRMNWTRGRHAMQPSLLWLAYQSVHNFILDEDIVGPVNPRTGLPVRFPTRLFLVFGGQIVAITTFFFFFPHVVDKSALTLEQMYHLLLKIAYTLLLKLSRQRIRTCTSD